MHAPSKITHPGIPRSLHLITINSADNQCNQISTGNSLKPKTIKWPESEVLDKQPLSYVSKRGSHLEPQILAHIGPQQLATTSAKGQTRRGLGIFKPVEEPITLSFGCQGAPHLLGETAFPNVSRPLPLCEQFKDRLQLSLVFHPHVSLFIEQAFGDHLFWCCRLGFLLDLMMFLQGWLINLNFVLRYREGNILMLEVYCELEPLFGDESVEFLVTVDLILLHQGLELDYRAVWMSEL